MDRRADHSGEGGGGVSRKRTNPGRRKQVAPVVSLHCSHCGGRFGVELRSIGTRRTIKAAKPVAAHSTPGAGDQSELDHLRPDLRAEAMRRHRILQAWYAALERCGSNGGVTHATGSFLALLRKDGERVSRSRLYCWDRAYRNKGLRGLVRGHRFRRNTA